MKLSVRLLYTGKSYDHPVVEARCHLTRSLHILSFLAVISLFGCQNERPPQPSPSAPPSPQASKRIAITQITTHPGIDAVRKGFVDEMERQGYHSGKEVTYELSNANGDFTAAQGIAKRIAGSSPDLVFAISTPSAQTCIEATKKTSIPIVFGAITDPVSAGIVTSLDRPGGRVTGTSDIWPYAAQFKLLRQLVPRARRIGILFNPSESNSKSSVQQVMQVAKQNALQIVPVSVSNSNEVPAAARSLVGRVDAIYIPADNTVISAIAAVVAVSEKNRLPLMPGDTSNVEVGGFGTVGHDYGSIGAESARIAVKILRGTPAGTIPVATAPIRQFYFNVRSAKATGVIIPPDLLKQAAKVYSK